MAKDYSVKETCELMLDAREKQNYSENTLRGLRAEGRKLQEFFTPYLPVRLITPGRMTEYLEWRNASLSVASMNTALNRLVEWLKFCERVGAGPTRALIEGWRRAPVPPTPNRTFIPKAALPRVLDCAGDPRDRILIALMWWTGVRPNEATSLKIGDIDWTRNKIGVTRRKVADKIWKAIEEGLRVELARWLAYYYKSAMPSALPRDQWILIPQREQGFGGSWLVPERRLGERATRALVHDVLAAAGYSGGASTLRHSAGSELYDSLTAEGVADPLRRVQAFLVHRSVTTTEGYLNRTRLAELDADTAAMGLLTPVIEAPTGVALAPVIPIMRRRRNTA